MAEPNTTLPSNPESEIALLSLAINSEESYFQLQEIGVKPEMFFSEVNQYLYNLIGSLTEKLKQHPPIFEIAAHLKSNNLTEEYEACRKAYNTVVTNQVLTRHTENLLDAFRKREFLRMSARLTQMAFDKHTPAEACTMFASAALESIEQATRPLEVYQGDKLADHMLQYYEQSKDLPPGTEWGLEKLDRLTRGTRLGELTVISAPPGHGKSSLVHQIAYLRASTTSRAQLIITVGDMNKEQVVNRILQQQTGVSSVDLSYGNFISPNKFDHTRQINGYLNRFREIPLYIVEGIGFSSSDVRRVIKSLLKRETHFDVYLDYMQQLSDKGDIYERTSQISMNILNAVNGLKDKNGNNAISLTALSSVNKSGEYFGASNIGHDVANNFSLKLDKPDEVEDFNQLGNCKAVLKIEKQRYGPSGFKVPLWFHGSQTRFYNEEQK
jgi:replicative DNA helicase